MAVVYIDEGNEGFYKKINPLIVCLWIGAVSFIHQDKEKQRVIPYLQEEIVTSTSNPNKENITIESRSSSNGCFSWLTGRTPSSSLQRTLSQTSSISVSSAIVVKMYKADWDRGHTFNIENNKMVFSMPV